MWNSVPAGVVDDPGQPAAPLPLAEAPRGQPHVARARRLAVVHAAVEQRAVLQLMHQLIDGCVRSRHRAVDAFMRYVNAAHHFQ